MLEEHFLRSRIVSQIQHPFKHTTSDFSYVNPAFVGTTVEAALNWIFAVLYPQTQPSVANVAALPAAGNTINDYRIVSDDGDGKAASYRWEQREGDVAAKWYKVYDMDWGESTILSNFLTKTQDVYVFKYGLADRDDAGALLAGDLAGQHIYGGDAAGQHLTLHANSGDGTGAQTGAVQFDSLLRPTTDGAIDLGDSSHKLQTGYFGTSVIAGDMTVSDGSIVSSSGAISFSDENLSTTGTFAAGVTTVDGQAVLQEITTPSNPAAGYNSIYFKADDKLYRLDSAGTEKLVGLEFTSSNDNRLVKSVGTGADAIEETGIIVSDTDQVTGILELTSGNLQLIGNSLVSVDTNGDINFTPDGTGAVVSANLTVSNLNTANRLVVPNASGTFGLTGAIINGSDELSGVTKVTVDTLSLDGSTLAATGSLILSGVTDIQVDNHLLPDTTSTLNLGSAAAVYNDIFLDNALKTASETFLINELMDLRSANYRDAARTLPVQDGDTIFWDAANGVWLASVPDSEILHSSISGLTTGDAGHSQFVMLSGRSGGQEVIGGTDAADNLLLSSTSHATKGSILFKDNLFPFTNANFTTSWQGTDLGGSSNYLRDIYTKGEHFGMRFENVTSGTLPVASANNKGRMVYATDNNKIYVDTGAAVKVAGASRFVADQAFNGTDLTKTVDVSSEITDARNCIVQLLDNTNNFERIFCELEAISASQVKITTNVPLPAASYRLVVIE